MTQTRVRIGRIAIDGMAPGASGSFGADNSPSWQGGAGRGGAADGVVQNHPTPAHSRDGRAGRSAFAQRLEAAISVALRHAPGAQHNGASLPQLRVTLPHGASEADVAAAVANALREAIARDPEYQRHIVSVA